MLRQLETPHDDGFTAIVARPQSVLRALDYLLPSLTITEQRRADKLVHPADSDAYVAARLLARCVIARTSQDQDADKARISQVCDQCGPGDHGRPVVMSDAPSEIAVHVSWSHSRLYVLAAAGRRPVGVDIEPAGAEVPITRRVFTAGERHQIASAAKPELEALALWTRKEALVKIGRLRLDSFGTTDVRSTAIFGVAGLRLWTLVTPNWVASFSRELDVSPSYRARAGGAVHAG